MPAPPWAPSSSGSRSPPEVADRARSLLSPLRDLFAAVFFVSFGLSVVPSAIWPVIGVALALAFVTSLTKIATGCYAAKLDGVRFNGRLRAGTALVARGEFSIVIAGLVATAGSEEVKPLATAYVLVLAITGPLLAKYSDNLADWLRRQRRSDLRRSRPRSRPPRLRS